MSTDTDRIPPTVGSPATERGLVCAHSRMPGDPPCEQQATVHIVADDPGYGRVSLASCAEHEAIARAAGSFVAAHPYLPGFCGREDADWDEATNRCAVNLEPQLRAAGWVPLAEVLEALRDEAEQQLARAHDLPERAYARGVAYSSQFLAERFGTDQTKETTT